MSSESLRKRREIVIQKIEKDKIELNIVYEETNRVKTVAENTRVILDDLDKQFCEKTGLNSEEVALMFFAVGLQIARQYLLTKFPKRLSDKEAAKKILALVPEAWMKKIPFFVRRHATTKTIEFMAKEYPELFAVAKREGELPEKEKNEIRQIINNIYEERMKKHNIK